MMDKESKAKMERLYWLKWTMEGNGELKTTGPMAGCCKRQSLTTFFAYCTHPIPQKGSLHVPLSFLFIVLSMNFHNYSVNFAYFLSYFIFVTGNAFSYTITCIFVSRCFIIQKKSIENLIAIHRLTIRYISDTWEKIMQRETVTLVLVKFIQLIMLNFWRSRVKCAIRWKLKILSAVKNPVLSQTYTFLVFDTKHLLILWRTP